MVDQATLSLFTKQNSARWVKCHISPKRLDEVNREAVKIMAGKATYLEVEKAIGVPWWVVGIIHYRECDLSWRGSLAQGDPWNEVSKHVPRGIGPFHSWMDAALFSLTKAPPYASRWKDWSPGGALTLLVQYNGLGYDLFHHEASPYNWGATDQEEWGKYVADNKWSAHVWDMQIGCAALMKALGVGATNPEV